MVLAVKVFNQHSEAAFDTFDVECDVLRNIRPKNLSKVLSSLVLEYMSNTYFEKWLYSHNYFLDMKQRLDIMIEPSIGISSPRLLNTHCSLQLDA
ncbi:hypothetical protein ACS0TY_019338 [Phlomoides rotata]